MITLKQWQEMSLQDRENYIRRSRIEDLDESDIDCLCRNLKLFTRFIQEAHKVPSRRNHYSSRTIIEFLRHETLEKDDDLDYKINNNIAPKMSSASMEIFPSLNGLFYKRKSNSKVLDTLHP